MEIKINQENLNYFKEEINKMNSPEYNREPKVYKQKELEKFQGAIEKAREAWREACKVEFQRTGDSGSCIMGDGIYVFAIPPRCRKPQKIMLIRSSSVALAQGSLHYEACYKVAIEILKEAGLEAHYDYGRMD